MSKVITTNSPYETIKLGRKIAKILKPSDVVFLYGELGSGKTVLVKGICRGLGVRENVTSSSFVIATEYKGKMKVSHIDLYRLKKEETKWLPIEEYKPIDGLTIIEWADHIASQDKRGLHIKIEIVSEKKRQIEIEDLRD